MIAISGSAGAYEAEEEVVLQRALHVRVCAARQSNGCLGMVES